MDIKTFLAQNKSTSTPTGIKFPTIPQGGQSRLPLGGTSISAPKVDPTRPQTGGFYNSILYKVLPKRLREGFFGTGVEYDNGRQDKGLSGFLFPDTFKSQQQQYDYRVNKLTEAGIDPRRASVVAQNSVTNTETPDLTFQEKRILFTSGGLEAGGKALEAIDVISGGTIKSGRIAAAKLSREAITELVRAVDRAGIQTTLRPLGLNPDETRELAESIRMTNTETKMRSGERSVYIQRLIDDAVRKNRTSISSRGGSVVSVVDTKTGENVFYTVSPQDLKVLSEDLIDGTMRGIAGKQIDGKIYHLTAKTPAQMIERAGFKNGGQKTLDEIIQMITPKARRVPIREEGTGRLLGSFMDDPAYKKAASEIAAESKLRDQIRAFQNADEFVGTVNSIIDDVPNVNGIDALPTRAPEDMALRESVIQYLNTPAVRQMVDDGMRRDDILREFFDSTRAPGYRARRLEDYAYNRTLPEVSKKLKSIFGREVPILELDPKTYGKDVLGATDGTGRYSVISLLRRNETFDEAVATHEGWHWFKRNLSTAKRKELDQLELEFARENKDRIKALREQYPQENLSDEAYEKMLREEALADEFAEFYTTGQTVFAKLKRFFEQALEVLGMVYKQKNDIMKRVTQTFKDVKSTLRDNPFDGVAKRPRNKDVAMKQLAKEFENFKDLSTKFLGKLEGRATVSKQFLVDLVRSPDLKQAERDIINSVLAGEGDKVNVTDFANKVKAELLPLRRQGESIEFKDLDPNDPEADYEYFDAPDTKYESIVLPDELRGPVYVYAETVYESPIKTSAGNIHRFDTENYFAHVRREDMAKGFNPDGTPDEDAGIRRVIEIQSDLMQKGRLKGEFSMDDKFRGLVNRKRVLEDQIQNPSKFELEFNPNYKDELEKALVIVNKDLEQYRELYTARKSEIARLEPYEDIWHERIIREEIQAAAKDGMTKLRFPVGETAMKIEGLGQQGNWLDMVPEGSGRRNPVLEQRNLKVGNEIISPQRDRWIITDVLGDGKFKAVPKDKYIKELERAVKEEVYTGTPNKFYEKGQKVWTIEEGGNKLTFPTRAEAESRVNFIDRLQTDGETFDISGKIDTNNPIYKFYESTVSKYLKNKYGAKRITDERGVEWMEIAITKEMADNPVEAFKKVNVDEKYSLILTQFAGAEKGERIAVTDKDGYMQGKVAKHSTFPQWLPDDLRSRELLDKYLEGRTGSMDDFSKEYKEGSRLGRIDDAVRQYLFETTGNDVRRIPDDLAYIDDMAEQYRGELDTMGGRDSSTLRDPNMVGSAQGIETGTGAQTPQSVSKAGTSDELYSRKAKEQIVNIAQRQGEPVKDTVRRFEGLRRIKANILEYVQNTDERIRLMQERKDLKIEDASNIYQRMTNMSGRLGNAIEKAREEAKTVLEDIRDTASRVGTDSTTLKSEVDDYLIARHAPERNEALEDGAAGMKTAEAIALRDKLEASPRGAEIIRIANQVQQINDRTLDILKDGQIITEELYNKLRTKYKNHVPLYRINEGIEDFGSMLTGKGYDVRSTGIKKAKGSDKEIDDILGNVIFNYEQALIRVEKNFVDLATLKFVRDNAENLKGLMEEVELPFLPVGTVLHKGQYADEVFAKVNELITKYGGTHDRTLKSGRNFGTYSPGTNTVMTRFGTSKETLIHEFGHMLDEKFGLKNSNFFDSATSKELRAVADLRKGRRAYVRKGEEKIAEFISMYFTDFANAERVAPLTTGKFTRFLNDKPELRELVDVMKSRSRAQEIAQETVFAQQRFTNDPQILTLRENGKAKYIKVKDPNLAVAIRGIGREKLGGILNAVGAFTRFYSGLHTRFNPDFAAPNKIRDLQEVVTYMASQKDIGVKGALKTAGRDPASIKAVYDAIRGNDTEGARLYNEMKAAGGTTGGMGLSTRKTVELDMKRLEKIVNSRTRRSAEAIVEYVDYWNTIFEDSTRLSVYKTARESGASIERAAFLAKEASVNFNRMGKGGPVINAIWMFSNASIQGSTKMLRAMRNPKVALAVASTITASVAATSEWNDWVDPEWRDKTPKWDRMNSFVVVLPTDDSFETDDNGFVKSNAGFRYVAIPVSWGLKPIKVMADYAYDAVSGKPKDAKEIVNGLFSSIIEGYNPVGGTDAVSALAPTILDTPFEIGRNKSWTGFKITPTNYTNAPDDTLYFKSLGDTSTGKASIALSELLAKNGVIEVSPANMKYAYDQYVGGAGRFVTKLFNSISGAIMGDPPPIDEYPFVSRFYRERSAEEIEKTPTTETVTLDRLSDEDARVKKKQNVARDTIASEIMEMKTSAEKKARLKALAKEDPKLAEKVLDRIDELSLGLTNEESRLKDATVAVRAEYIREKMQGMTREEKKAYLKELAKKKILTDAVMDELGL